MGNRYLLFLVVSSLLSVSYATQAPTITPTAFPSESVTLPPTSGFPSGSPTGSPSESPTALPSPAPTAFPSPNITSNSTTSNASSDSSSGDLIWSDNHWYFIPMVSILSAIGFSMTCVGCCKLRDRLRFIDTERLL